ncbi:aldehyde dehydrogenase (NADP(+)) [Microscilla marina]|uniref:Aldehyde dehydrogenase n=1 Tax=Microscilla marina ATCC 23134 TaxID=313606 RepID=A1ZYV6_MICM2|nr:aldehyde dehydrogenase (NADP(+)) [Microscilla marina]EAY24453.1 aldehyde dehydrogenase [Microscilla marina ATCC 23134]
MTKENIQGKNFIGNTRSDEGQKQQQAFNPANNEVLTGAFSTATNSELEQTMQLASEAFQQLKKYSGAQKGAFLRAIAEEIEALGDTLVQRACIESGLPEGRIIGERGRTMNQLRAFAQLVEEGSWVDARIDTAQPERQPIPKVDLRKQLVAIGPVVVFGASNFPLAFSVAGGDTASALAAGNPVIVKAHSAHLGTSELVATAVIKAAERCDMPNGTFSMLYGSGHSVGQALVKHPVTQAVGFTGSGFGGKALYQLAQQRPQPIPVFAEMGSVNPVVLLPQALRNRGAQIAQQYAGSITLGAGQFCTNPGLLLGVASDELIAFETALGEAVQAIAPATMLTQGIAKAFDEGAEQALKQTEVQIVAQADQSSQPNQGRAVVAKVSGADFLKNPALHEEVFGPYSLLVVCANREELAQAIQSLEGQLTATVMGEDEELLECKEIIAGLQDRVGRLIYNGVPTGVEVCPSQHHGGPFPSTTDSRFTSVGTDAIKRFARPVAFQNCPQALLPQELQDENPLNIWRLTDGKWSNEAISVLAEQA